MSMDRPALHFTPQRGWINDPNGLIWDGKRYHLFAQHNPEDTVWGPMHWLHAVSTDMLHWREEGIALYPDGWGTMFSGSAAMLPDGRMALMYTAHGDQERQCVAFSEDGIRFEKYAGNPVIDNPGLRDFRDPKLFWNRKRGCWGVAVAAGPCVAFYRSDDLLHWQKTGEFAVTRLGELFECPDLFFLKTPEGEEIAVLTASMICLNGESGCRMQFFLGAFDGETFVERYPAGEALRMDGGYELIAGHRRKRGCELAGLDTMPVIVRNLDDDASTIIVVDSNIQRESLLPSERAFAYKMKLEAIKRQGARTDLTSGQVVQKSRLSVEIVANQAGENYKQVQRYIRLTELVPDLLDMVDAKKIAFNPAVELSYLKPEEQTALMEAMDSEQATPSLSQAQRLKRFSQEGTLTSDMMRAILSEEKKADMDRVTLTGDTLRKYFLKSYTPCQMEQTILKLLEGWHRRRQQSQER